ncbi:MAG: M48 family metallopeptidase [Rhodanobacteraceae bacterium]
MAAYVDLEARWGRHRLPFRLRRADVKRLRIVVDPEGAVRVTAPRRASNEAIVARVSRRGDWIQRQRECFARWRPRTPPRQYLSGETHLFLGRQLRLRVERGTPPGVAMVDTRLVIRVANPDDRLAVRDAVSAWFAAQARQVLRQRYVEQGRVWARHGVTAPRLVARALTNRWGSYSAAGTLTLNAELVHASPYLIDYVIAHELAHTIHSDHGNEWRRLLERVMPDWKARKAALEAQLL